LYDIVVEILGRTSLTSLHAITQSVVGRDPFNTFLRICVLIQLWLLLQSGARVSGVTWLSVI